MSKSKERIMSIILLCVGIIWGYGFIAVQKSLDAGFSPTMINFIRFFIASLLTFIFFAKRIIKMTKKDFVSGLLPATMMAFGFIFQNLGQKYTTPGNNALITGSYTILVPLILALFFKEKQRKIAYIAACVTFLGIIILSIPSFTSPQIRIGDLFSFIATIFFALQFITLDKALKNSDAKIQTFVQLLVSCILCFIVALIFDLKSIENVDFSKGILPVLYLGVFSSFIAYVIQTFAQKYIGPTKVAVILASESLFGALLSVLFKYESITVYLVVGGIFTLVGIALAQIPHKNKNQIQVDNENE